MLLGLASKWWTPIYSECFIVQYQIFKPKRKRPKSLQIRNQKYRLSINSNFFCFIFGMIKKRNKENDLHKHIRCYWNLRWSYQQNFKLMGQGIKKSVCSHLFRSHWRMNDENTNNSIILNIILASEAKQYTGFSTYKYCKFESWPSCETSWPERFAFPRSLWQNMRIILSQLMQQECLIDGQNHISNLHSRHTIVTVARNMKPSAGIYKGGIPTLKNIVGISHTCLQCIQGITCLREKQFSGPQTSLISNHIQSCTS